MQEILRSKLLEKDESKKDNSEILLLFDSTEEKV